MNRIFSGELIFKLAKKNAFILQKIDQVDIDYDNIINIWLNHKNQLLLLIETIFFYDFMEVLFEKNIEAKNIFYHT